MSLKRYLLAGDFWQLTVKKSFKLIKSKEGK